MSIDFSTRWAWAEVHTGLISHNVAIVAQRTAPVQVWAVVKANGYGHGAIQVANAALAAEKAARAADKVASDKALADAKAASDSATVTAKVASDLALATAAAKYKAEYNALATKWNKKFPKLKVALKK